MASPNHNPAHLRLLTQALEDVPAERLMHALPMLLTLISKNKDVFSDKQSTPNGSNTQKTEQGVFLHRLKTQVSTILQHRHAQTRYAAIVLVKALLEIGDNEMLQTSGAWVKSLVAVLGKRTEHDSVKRASLITLTRVFFLSYRSQSLVREMTTPVLQSFITNCLSNVWPGKNVDFISHPHPKLVKSILQAFIALLPRHPASFRPHIGELRLGLSRLVIPYRSWSTRKPDIEYGKLHLPDSIHALARRLLALLPLCAPKNGSAEEWAGGLSAIMDHIERTASLVFRSIRENRATRSDEHSHNEEKHDFRSNPGDKISDFLKLEPWQGILEGCERLIGCLDILGAFIATSSQSNNSLDVAKIWNSMDRILAIYGPSTVADGKETLPTFHPEADRKERERLFLQLPQIHQAALEVLLLLIMRLGNVSFGVSELVLDRIVWGFNRECENEAIRNVVYKVATKILDLAGPSMRHDDLVSLQPILSAASEDVQRSCFIERDDPNVAESILGKTASIVSGQPRARYSRPKTSLQLSASRFLSSVFRQLPFGTLPTSTRIMIDRAAILAKDREALLASVLNPAQDTMSEKITSSNLPFLARAYPRNGAVEALIRPRLPPIHDVVARQNDYQLPKDDMNYIASRGTNGVSLTASSSFIESRQEEELGTWAGALGSIDPNYHGPGIPKRRRQSTTEGLGEYSAAGDIQPVHKRLKEQDLPAAVLADASHEKMEEKQGNFGAQPAISKYSGTDWATADVGEDFEIPQIQMPSDFEDSDKEM